MYIQQQFISTLMGFLLMKKIAYSLIGLTALFGANTVFAAGDVAAGKVKAAVCAACHGANGIAMMPGYPNLAGQNEAYLVSAMKAYRDNLSQHQQVLLPNRLVLHKDTYQYQVR